MPLWRTKSNHSQTPSESDPKNDPVASASQAAGTAWLAGHPNHLTEQQEKSLQDFKKLCEENGYYKADAGEGKPSHDDATMLYVCLVPLSSVLALCWAVPRTAGVYLEGFIYFANAMAHGLIGGFSARASST